MQCNAKSSRSPAPSHVRSAPLELLNLQLPLRLLLIHLGTLLSQLRPDLSPQSAQPPPASSTGRPTQNMPISSTNAHVNTMPFFSKPHPLPAPSFHTSTPPVAYVQPSSVNSSAMRSGACSPQCSWYARSARPAAAKSASARKARKSAARAAGCEGAPKELEDREASGRSMAREKMRTMLWEAMRAGLVSR